MTRPFVIITTRLPPAVCGIGNYSAILRKHWPNESTPVEFLVVGEAAGAERIGSNDNITEFGEEPRRLRAALRKIGAADLLLHYAGRAYNRIGCPTWLPGVIASWKWEFPESRITIFMHEVPGDMPVTSRHFWLGKLNARIIRQLAAVADVLATNTDGHAANLRRITRRNNILVLPVGSNIDVSRTEIVSRGADAFVLFGLPFGRLQTLQLFTEYIRAWSERGQLRKLHIIGPEDEKFAAAANGIIASLPNGVGVTRHGMLSPADVSRQLARARFALTNVTPETWSKSGAFMAAAAHRCAVVRTGSETDVLPLSFTVTADEVASIAPDEVERRTAALEHWYRANADWPVIAEKLAMSSEPARVQS